MAHFKILREITELKAVPIAKTFVEGTKVLVELHDDVRIIRVVFSPYQAVRVTTADCFALSEGMMITPRTIMEVEDSDWIEQLKKSLAKVDTTANFMNRSRHFLVPTEDNFIEIASWSLDYEEEKKLGRKGVRNLIID